MTKLALIILGLGVFLFGVGGCGSAGSQNRTEKRRRSPAVILEVRLQDDGTTRLEDLVINGVIFVGYTWAGELTNEKAPVRQSVNRLPVDAGLKTVYIAANAG